MSGKNYANKMRERKIGGLGGLDMACRWTFSIVIKQLNSKMDPENLSDFFFFNLW